MNRFSLNIMSLAFLAAAMFLFTKGSNQWGWLVFISTITTLAKSQPTEPKAKSPKDLIKEVEKQMHDRAN